MKKETLVVQVVYNGELIQFIGFKLKSILDTVYATRLIYKYF